MAGDSVPRFVSRPWRSPGDTAGIQALLSRRLDHDWPAVRMHPGDLDWWIVHASGSELEVTERCRVWLRGDSEPPIAFAWFTPPGDLDIVVDHDALRPEAVAAEALAWAGERRDRTSREPVSPVRAWAVADSVESVGFDALGLVARPGPGDYLQLTGPLDDGAMLTAAPLPNGLTVRPISDADVDARVVCSRAAFTTSRMTAERYRRTFLGQTYRGDLDLVVVDEAGAVLAFALGWLDPATRVVELEPVGVHPDRHRSGLGGAVCRAVLGAVRDLGATRAMITANRSNPAAVGLYRSLSLEVSAEIVPYVAPAQPARPEA